MARVGGRTEERLQRRKDEEGREGKEGREAVGKNPSPEHGTEEKTPNHRHRTQASRSHRTQANLPRRPILATSRKLIIQYRFALQRKNPYIRP
jgi:hypothetical protein